MVDLNARIVYYAKHGVSDAVNRRGKYLEMTGKEIGLITGNIH